MNVFFAIFLYYFSFSSAVLIHGIGLKQAAVSTTSFFFIKTYCIKNLFTTLIAAVFCRFFSVTVLIPFNLQELLPLIVILIVPVVSYFLLRVMHKDKNDSQGEILVSVLTILLSVNESTSFLQLISIVFTCWAGIFALQIILYAINSRARYAPSIKPDEHKSGVLIFLSITFILLALYGWNFSWLNAELFW